MFDSLTSTEHSPPDDIVSFDDLDTFSTLATSEAQYGHYQVHFSVTLDDYPGFSAQTLSLPAEVVPHCEGSVFTELIANLFEVGPQSSFQQMEIFSSYTHVLSGVYVDYCGPVVLELDPGITPPDYLSLEQPGLLKFHPTATDPLGTFIHHIRAKL